MDPTICPVSPQVTVHSTLRHLMWTRSAIFNFKHNSRFLTTMCYLKSIPHSSILCLSPTNMLDLLGLHQLRHSYILQRTYIGHDIGKENGTLAQELCLGIVHEHALDHLVMVFVFIHAKQDILLPRSRMFFFDKANIHLILYLQEPPLISCSTVSLSIVAAVALISPRYSTWCQWA